MLIQFDIFQNHAINYYNFTLKSLFNLFNYFRYCDFVIIKLLIIIFHLVIRTKYYD